ncbi:hypothetical protein Tco_0417845 [Tanacetum coccineum]
MDVHLQELEQVANSKIYAHVWVVQMDKEVRNDNDIARKLLDVVKDLDKSLAKRKEIINELNDKRVCVHGKLLRFPGNLNIARWRCVVN